MSRLISPKTLEIPAPAQDHPRPRTQLGKLPLVAYFMPMVRRRLNRPQRYTMGSSRPSIFLQ